MAIAFVQTTNGKTAGATSIATSAFGSNTTTGNAIIVGVANGSTGVSVVTGVADSAGNTYTKAVTSTSGAGSVQDIWYALNITGGSGVTVTATASASNEMHIYAQEFSGIFSVGALDKTATGNGTSTTLNTPGINSTINGELIFVAGLNNNGVATYTAGSGFSNLSQQTGTFMSSAVESLVIAASANRTTVLTSSSSTAYREAAVNFKPDIAGMTRLTNQDSRGQSTTTSVSATYPAATTAGNLLIADLYSITGSSSVTGPSGFTAANTNDFSAGAQTVITYYKIADGTETTISASATGSTQMRIHIYEYKGFANPVVLDGINGNTSATTSVSTIASNNITTVNVNDMIHVALGLGGSTASHTFTNSFSFIQADASTMRLATGDLYVTSTGSYGTTASWSTAVRAGIAITAFQAATAGGGGGPFPPTAPVNTLLMMGVGI